MKKLNLTYENIDFDFKVAKAVADAIANSLIEEPTCLSWYDKQRDVEAPANVSECHDACEFPGYVDYAENRGAELKLNFNRGDFVFYYRSLAVPMEE